MFGARAMFNMARSVINKPVFKISHSFSTMAPVYLETTSLLNRVTSLPTHMIVRNLLQMIQKAQQGLQLQADVNISQIRLLSQGKLLLNPSNWWQFDSIFQNNLGVQAGLIKQSDKL